MHRRRQHALLISQECLIHSTIIIVTRIVNNHYSGTHVLASIIMVNYFQMY